MNCYCNTLSDLPLPVQIAQQNHLLSMANSRGSGLLTKGHLRNSAGVIITGYHSSQKFWTIPAILIGSSAITQ